MFDAFLRFMFEDYGRVRSIRRQTFREGPFKGVETVNRFMRIQLYSGAALVALW